MKALLEIRRDQAPSHEHELPVHPHPHPPLDHTRALVQLGAPGHTGHTGNDAVAVRAVDGAFAPVALPAKQASWR